MHMCVWGGVYSLTSGQDKFPMGVLCMCVCVCVCVCVEHVRQIAFVQVPRNSIKASGHFLIQ
jgi:hypothetical protein